MQLFRRAAASLARRIRVPSQVANPSSFSTVLQFPSTSQSRRSIRSNEFGFGSSTWRRSDNRSLLWIIAAGQAAIFIGNDGNPVLADASVESSPKLEETGEIGLQKIDDGSVVSNIHTSKWRVFTDSGRDYFLQGKLDNAEKLFISALNEAKEGFGEKDPHVASACNNLAELYRVKKEFGKAEPLYLKAINVLEETFGPEDIRVGAALHNMGQFYLVQRKLEEACKCYERSLKIKGRVLGFSNPDYADTMYHLGTVMYLMGKHVDAEVLIQDSIRITEEGGQGESATCIRRLRYLAQIYLRSNRLVEAESVQRKVLHIMELSKGWQSMDTLMTAQGLVQTLLSSGNFSDAQELLERCLDGQKSLLPEDHIQNAATMAELARAVVGNLDTRRNVNLSEAVHQLEKANDLLKKSMRISQKVLDRLRKAAGSRQKQGSTEGSRREGRVALITLLQSLDILGLLEIKQQELQEKEQKKYSPAAEAALSRCISVYKEFEAEKSISNFPEVKSKYLSCLKRLLTFISSTINHNGENSKSATLEELNDEINRVEAEISRNKGTKA